MRRLVHEGAKHPLVRQRAREIIRASPHLHPIDACFRFVRSLPYRRDESIAAEEGLSDTAEIIQGAPYQLELERRYGPGAVEGDCDCRCVLLASLLESLNLGYRTAFVLVRGPGRSDFSHVYLEARVPGPRGRGRVRRIPLDTIMDGNGGRPLFKAGDEVGPEMVRGRRVIPVRKKGLGAAVVGGLVGLAGLGLAGMARVGL